MEKKRSPWPLMGAGFACLVLAVVVVIVLAMLEVGGAVAILFGGVFALAGFAMLLAGAIAMGVRASR